MTSSSESGGPGGIKGILNDTLCCFFSRMAPGMTSMLCAFFFFRGGMTPDSASSSGICLNPFLCMSHLCRLSEQRHGRITTTAAHSKMANTAKTPPVMIIFRLKGVSFSLLALSCGKLGVVEVGVRDADVCRGGGDVETNRLLEDISRVVSLAVLRTSVE